MLGSFSNSNNIYNWVAFTKMDPGSKGSPFKHSVLILNWIWNAIAAFPSTILSLQKLLGLSSYAWKRLNLLLLAWNCSVSPISTPNKTLPATVTWSYRIRLPLVSMKCNAFFVRMWTTTIDHVSSQGFPGRTSGSQLPNRVMNHFAFFMTLYLVWTWLVHPAERGAHSECNSRTGALVICYNSWTRLVHRS